MCRIHDGDRHRGHNIVGMMDQNSAKQKRSQLMGAAYAISESKKVAMDMIKDNDKTREDLENMFRQHEEEMQYVVQESKRSIDEWACDMENENKKHRRNATKILNESKSTLNKYQSRCFALSNHLDRAIDQTRRPLLFYKHIMELVDDINLFRPKAEVKITVPSFKRHPPQLKFKSLQYQSVTVPILGENPGKQFYVSDTNPSSCDQSASSVPNRHLPNAGTQFPFPQSTRSEQIDVDHVELQKESLPSPIQVSDRQVCSSGNHPSSSSVAGGIPFVDLYHSLSGNDEVFEGATATDRPTSLPGLIVGDCDKDSCISSVPANQSIACSMSYYPPNMHNITGNDKHRYDGEINVAATPIDYFSETYDQPKKSASLDDITAEKSRYHFSSRSDFSRRERDYEDDYLPVADSAMLCPALVRSPANKSILKKWNSLPYIAVAQKKKKRGLLQKMKKSLGAMTHWG